MGPVLRKTVNGIFGDSSSDIKRHWHLVEKPISVGNKYLPPVHDPYPDEYTGNNTGFKVEFGYTLHYHDPSLVTEAESESSDEEWGKFVAKWQRRYEESAWWQEKYREMEAAGYYLDEKGILQRHDVGPGVPDIDWTATLREKMKWDPKPKPTLHTLEEETEDEEAGKDVKGKGKEKVPELEAENEEGGKHIKGKGKEKATVGTDLEAEDSELDREVPSEEVQTSDLESVPPRFSFEMGGEHFTLKDPRAYDPPFPPGDSSSGPSHAKDEEDPGEDTEEDSLRKYWSSDESNYWKTLKQSKLPRAQAKQELEMGQRSSSGEEIPKEPPGLWKPAKQAEQAKPPPKLFSVFDDSSSSGAEKSKEPTGLWKLPIQAELAKQPPSQSLFSSGTLGSRPSKSKPKWKFSLSPPPTHKPETSVYISLKKPTESAHSDADESASVYSQDVPTPKLGTPKLGTTGSFSSETGLSHKATVKAPKSATEQATEAVQSDADDSASVYSQEDAPTPNTFGQPASPQAKALMDYIKPLNIKPKGHPGEGSSHTQEATQAQTSSEPHIQLGPEPGEEKPEKEPEEETDSDSDEDLNESSEEGLAHPHGAAQAQTPSEHPIQLPGPEPGEEKPEEEPEEETDEDSDEDLNESESD